MPKDKTEHAHEQIGKFEAFAKNLPRAVLGGALKEYIAESAHGSWDGFSDENIQAIGAFLADFQTYVECEEGDINRFRDGLDNINTIP